MEILELTTTVNVSGRICFDIPTWLALGEVQVVLVLVLVYCCVIMKQYIEIRCRHGGTDDPVRSGLNENGTQRCRCNECGRSFQNEYSSNSLKLGAKE